MSCATVQTKVPEVQTVRSDLFPGKITRAEYYEQMAISYSQDNQHEKAVDYFRLSILHDPKRVSSHLHLSDEYRTTHLDHLASYEIYEALKLDPKNKLALHKLGDLYLDAKIYSKARQIYAKLLRIDKKNEEAFWALFYIYKIEKKYDAAIASIDQITETTENNFKIAYEKGMIYKEKRNEKLYQDFLTYAYSFNPYDKTVVNEYVKILFKQKKFADAVHILEAYTESHDFDLDISNSLAFAAIQSEHYDIALRELDKQRPWTSNRLVLNLKKAHIYYLINDLKKAEMLYLSVLNVKPVDEASFYLAQIYMTQDKYKEAEVLLEQVPIFSDYYGDAQAKLAVYEKQHIDEDTAINRMRTAHNYRPDQLILYKTYADFLIEAKRFVETVALLEKGIGFFQKDEDLRLKLAFVHYRLHNQKSFKKQIAKALKINPSSATIYSVLTELWYLKNKDASEVEFFAREALRLKSENKNIKPLLAWALMEQSNSTEAVALFEEFYEENPKEHFFAKSLAQAYSIGGVSTKAQEFSRVADVLENNDSLRSRLIFKLQNKTVESDLPNSRPARLPASLENQ